MSNTKMTFAKRFAMLRQTLQALLGSIEQTSQEPVKDSGKDIIEGFRTRWREELKIKVLSHDRSQRADAY